MQKAEYIHLVDGRRQNHKAMQVTVVSAILPAE